MISTHCPHIETMSLKDLLVSCHAKYDNQFLYVFCAHRGLDGYNVQGYFIVIE